MTKITISIDTDDDGQNVTITPQTSETNVGKSGPAKEERKEVTPLENESPKGGLVKTDSANETTKMTSPKVEPAQEKTPKKDDAKVEQKDGIQLKKESPSKEASNKTENKTAKLIPQESEPSDPENGLSPEEAAQRLEKFGSNTITHEK